MSQYVDVLMQDLIQVVLCLRSTPPLKFISFSGLDFCYFLAASLSQWL